MSVLEFTKCWARPFRSDGAHLLTTHLEQVALNTQKATFHDDKVSSLLYLAGLCHDIAKSHQKWQYYIRGKREKGPNHSHCSAFIFSYLAYHWLNKENCFSSYQREWLWLSQDISDHHTKLKFHRYNEFDWVRSYEWDQMDLNSMITWLKGKLINLEDISFTANDLDEWIDELFDLIEDVWLEAFDPEDESYSGLMSRLQYWRSLTTSLISGDRFDNLQFEYEHIDKDKAKQYMYKINEFCKKQSHYSLSEVRDRAQQEILNQYKNNKNKDVYLLSMPTGYGKTMTALKLASQMCRDKNKTKIAYIAPYLSILEQTGDAINETLGEKPLEHHSLALFSEEDLQDNKQQAPLQLISESWAHHLVCTSFQQFMKALFPYTAQDSLRRTFMQNSVVLIDEPQIFSADVWNLFLKGLEAFLKDYKVKVIFLSATLPPFENGLNKEPTLLKVSEDRNKPRFQIKQIEDLDEVTLSERIEERKEQKKGVILNTIKDANLVHEQLKGRQDNLQLLHGLMVPIHKMIQTDKIKKELNKEQPVTVVATQVLEAGVDVSFQYMYRALPILPSLVQAAGRVNRHSEFENGLVETSEFLREGHLKTSQFIYEKNLRNITDKLLSNHPDPTDLEVTALVNQYYSDMFKENFYESVLQRIRDAYTEDWRYISKLHPFGSDYFKLPIFVPWNFQEISQDRWPDSFKRLIKSFNITHPNEIYEKYCDFEYIYNLDFKRRKEFNMLFYFFVLNLPVKKALLVASKEDYLKQKIPYLYDDTAYHQEFGWQMDKSDNSWDFII